MKRGIANFDSLIGRTVIASDGSLTTILGWFFDSLTRDWRVVFFAGGRLMHEDLFALRFHHEEAVIIKPLDDGSVP